jgi:dTDP-glucose 4,6-dehydratase
VRYNSRSDYGLLKLLPENALAEMEIISGDLRDPAAVQAAARDVSHIFHLGALIAIPYSYVHPVEVAETNVMGTVNVLMAARDAGVERIIHTSTSEVYGTALSVPIDEDHPLQGQSPYSASKIGADKIAESFYCAFETPVVTVRPFNTYGPGQSARAVVPTIITQALAQSVVYLGNLDARRDMTFVSDTVAGFLLAAEVPGVEGETFNLGTGVEVRIGDLAAMIIELVGRPCRVAVEPERLRPDRSEVQRLLADNSLARKRLDWRPRVSLGEGLQMTLDWIREHLHLYQPGQYRY